MKKLLLTILLLITALLLLSSCSKNDGPFTEVSVSYDGQQRVIQKVMYNENNGCTWIYDYSYTTYNNGEVLCTNTTITIYDSNNRIIDQSTNTTYDNQPSLPVGSTSNNITTGNDNQTNNNQTNNNQTNSSNNNKPNNSTNNQFTNQVVVTPTNGANELVLMDQSGIKVTLTNCSYNTLLSCTEYKVIIENNNNFDVYVKTDNEYLNDVSCSNSLGFQFYTTIAAGKKATKTINMYDTVIADLEIDSVEKFEFTIHAVPDDNKLVYIAEQDVVFNLN